jgi:uncharacterized protein YndB with AHSA1/START domain
LPNVATTPSRTSGSVTGETDIAVSTPVNLGMSDEAVRRKTGKGWEEWLALIDAWGGREHNHTEIARWVNEVHGVEGWWAQGVTVGYERARGMRAVHQLVDGFSANGSKTVNVPVERLYKAFTDDTLRGRWLPDAALILTSPRPPKSLHASWTLNQAGAPRNTRLDFLFTAKGGGKSQVAVQHLRLHDASEADAMKSFWRDRLTALKELLEA